MNTNFGRTPVATVSVFIQSALQYLLTTIGVPLFLMLTGYLNCGKKVGPGYFPKVLRVVVSYVLISLVTYGVLLATGEEHFSLRGLANGLGSFSIIRYGWYINMYLGLFLLIPVMNIVIDAGLQDTANRRAWLWLTGGGYSPGLPTFDAQPLWLHALSRLLEKLLGAELLPPGRADAKALARTAAETIPPLAALAVAGLPGAMPRASAFVMAAAYAQPGCAARRGLRPAGNGADCRDFPEPLRMVKTAMRLGFFLGGTTFAGHVPIFLYY